MMGRPSKFIAGKVHGRLTAVSWVGGKTALYVCSCGAIKEASVSHVTTGRTQSCGCLHRELLSSAAIARSTKHGKFGSPIYGVWNGMMSRCHNPGSHAFDNYGARGITVDPRWRSFESFYADMGDAPEGMTLDRKDNSAGYSKDNCRWVSMKDQNNNKRSNVRLQFHGEVHNVTQWAEKLNIPRQVIYGRLKLGWSTERALTEPVRLKSVPRNRTTAKGG